MIIVFILFFVVLFTYILTGLVRQYSLQHSLIDKPNERSSHTDPVPTGGGLSISITVLASIFVLGLISWLPLNTTIAMFGGGCVVAAVGWLDDHWNLPAITRGIMYILAVSWALYFVGPVESINLGTPIIINVGAILYIMITIGMVWLINLYNFMDGTDGIAAIQGICTSALAGILFLINGEIGLALVCFVIAAACTGFIFWNWSPAKVFMGDVSSCLLGFMFGVLAILGEVTESIQASIWFILLAVFIWDATFTLLRRIFAGEKWQSAHRSHAYQKLTQIGISHSVLAIAVLVLNIAVLWPLAYAAHKWDNLSVYLLSSSIILMFILWFGIQLSYRRKVIGQIGNQN